MATCLTQAALGTSAAYLWVLEGNDRAIAFYRKIGFEPDGATKLLDDSGAVELCLVRR